MASEMPSCGYEMPSAGENWQVPGCKCRPTNVLYWELSEADPTDCPIHFDVPAYAMQTVNARLRLGPES